MALAKCSQIIFSAFLKFGSYQALEMAYKEAIPTQRPPNSSCGLPRQDAFHMFHSASADDMPWPGMIFGLTIIDIWYWCTDQVGHLCTRKKRVF